MSLNSALDALVEHLLVGLRDHFAIWFSEYVSRTLDGQSLPPIAPELRARAVEAAVTVALKRLDLDNVQKIPLKSSGAKRYEKGLRRVGLGAPEDRPIPADLRPGSARGRRASRRLGASRRPGRLCCAHPSADAAIQLRGRTVRPLHRRQLPHILSAALRCYGEEVMSRVVPPSPEHRVVLSDWRLYRVPNT